MPFLSELHKLRAKDAHKLLGFSWFPTVTNLIASEINEAFLGEAITAKDAAPFTRYRVKRGLLPDFEQ